jgi:hypothetical protein
MGRWTIGPKPALLGIDWPFSEPFNRQATKGVARRPHARLARLPEIDVP